MRQNNNFNNGGYKKRNQTANINIDKVINSIKNANKEYIEYAEYIGKEYSEKGKKGNKNSTHTLRSIYNYILSISNLNKDKTKLLLLKTKVAYLIGRNLIDENVPIKELINKAVDEIIKENNQDLLDKFKLFFEAIVAYNTYYSKKGGRNDR